MKHNLFRRLTVMTAGVLTLGAGVFLFICSGFGTDPFTCLNLGISARLGLSFGIWQLIANGIILVFVLFIRPRMIGVGTVVNMSLVGVTADLLLALFPGMAAGTLPFAARAALLLLGLTVLGLGAALYIIPNLGISPYDCIGFIAAEKTHADFRVCRIVCDAVFVLAGYLLGSRVGAGTLVAALCTGPFIRFFQKLLLPRLFPGAIETDK